MTNKKTDRIYWWMFATVAVCGFIIPCLLSWIWQVNDYWRILTIPEAENVWWKWWGEHNDDVYQLINRIASVISTAAMLILAYRYRLTLYIFGILTAVIYRVFSLVMITVTNFQAVAGTDFFGKVAWSTVVSFLFLLITYPLYFAVMQLRRVGLHFAWCAAIALVCLHLFTWLQSFATLETIYLAERLTSFLRNIPTYVVTLGLYFLLIGHRVSTRKHIAHRNSEK